MPEQHGSEEGYDPLRQDLKRMPKNYSDTDLFEIFPPLSVFPLSIRPLTIPTERGDHP
jgi:hypothetical protein